MADGKILRTIIDIGGNINPSLGKTISSVLELIGGLDKATVAAMAGIGAAGIAAYGAFKGIQALGKEIKRDIDAAGEWESHMAGVVKVTDGLRDETGEYTAQYYELSKALRGIGKDYQVDQMTDIADAAAAALQDGTISLKDGIDGVVKAVEDAIKGGQALDISMESAAQALSYFRLNFKMTEDQAYDTLDLINYLGQNSGRTPESINNMVVSLSGISELAGADAKSLAALAASVAGIDDSRAATALKNLFVQLESGTAATPRMNKAFARLGLSATDIAEGMQDDLLGTLREVFGAFDKLDESARLATFKDLFGKMSLEGVSILASNMDDIVKNMEIAAGTDYTGSIEKEVENLNNTYLGQKKLFDQTVEELRITAGEKLLPVLTDGMKDLGGFLDEHSDQIAGILSDLGGAIINEDNLEILEQFLTVAARDLPVMAENVTNFANGVHNFLSFDTGGAGGTIIGVLKDFFEGTMNFFTQMPGAIQTAKEAIGGFFSDSGGFDRFTTWLANGTWDGLTLGPLRRLFGYDTNELFSVKEDIDTVTGATDNLGGSAETASGKLGGAKTAAQNLGAVDLNAGTLGGSIDNINTKMSNLKSNAQNTLYAMRQLQSAGSIGPVNMGVLGGTYANGGFAASPSIFGEAGLEAAISFKPSQRQRNVGIWAKAGEMLGVLSREGGSYLSSGNGGITVTVQNNQTITVQQGSRENVVAALRQSEPEFVEAVVSAIKQAGVGRYDRYNPVY